MAMSEAKSKSKVSCNNPEHVSTINTVELWNYQGTPVQLGLSLTKSCLPVLLRFGLRGSFDVCLFVQHINLSTRIMPKHNSYFYIMGGTLQKEKPTIIVIDRTDISIRSFSTLTRVLCEQYTFTGIKKTITLKLVPVLPLAPL